MASKKNSPVPSYAGPTRTEQLRWQAEEDVRTLQRAAEIQQDKGRHTRAQKHAATQIKQLASVTRSSKGKR